MATKHRRSTGPAFGEGGGTNVADDLGLFDRVGEAEQREDAGERIADIPVDRIDRGPYQVRVDFDAGQLGALAEGVRENGLNHPVTVRATWRSFRACRRRTPVAYGAGRGTQARQARIRDLDDFEAHLVGVSEQR